MGVGGFPEVQKYPAETRIRTLQEYAQVAVFRDVVERHAVGHVQALQQVVRQLLAAPAQSLSVNKLFQGLKSQGFRLAKDTLYSDLRHLEDAFLIGTVEIDSPSARVRMTNPRKCYLIDPGLAHAFSLRAASNHGPLLENIVYLELRRRGYEIAYLLTASGRELSRGPAEWAGRLLSARLGRCCAYDEHGDSDANGAWGQPSSLAHRPAGRTALAATVVGVQAFRELRCPDSVTVPGERPQSRQQATAQNCDDRSRVRSGAGAQSARTGRLAKASPQGEPG